MKFRGVPNLKAIDRDSRFAFEVIEEYLQRDQDQRLGGGGSGPPPNKVIAGPTTAARIRQVTLQEAGDVVALPSAPKDTILVVTAQGSPTLKDGTGNLDLHLDATFAADDDIVILVSTGSRWREVSRLGSSFPYSFGCPVLIKGTDPLCFEVQNAGATRIFTVDTTNEAIHIVNGGLTWGAGALPAGYGFNFNDNQHARFLTGSFYGMVIDGTVDDEKLFFGSRDDPVTAGALGSHNIEFRERVGFEGGIGLSRVEITGDYTAQTEDTYIAATSIPGPGLTVTLPNPEAGAPAGAPAGPRGGTLVMVKDEAGLAESRNITIAAAGGASIEGAALIEADGGSVAYETDGAGYFIAW